MPTFITYQNNVELDKNIVVITQKQDEIHFFWLKCKKQLALFGLILILQHQKYY